jgi:hypothetical protein
MKREPGILQDWIEILAFEWRLRNTNERVGRHKNKQMKRCRDPSLHGECVGLKHHRQIVAEDCDQRAEEGQDRDPQHHRAFMISPDAGEAVNERHLRIGILEHVQN